MAKKSKKKRKTKKNKNETKKITAETQLYEFHGIFPKEIAEINSRRAELKRDPIELEDEGKDRYKNPIQRPTKKSKLVGVALSGGGIRSASFCLGVLQALNTLDHIKKVDYLSTVSGGGYIGTSMCAAMSSAKSHNFPYPSELAPDESPGLQHIRDYSNYLFPRAASSIKNLFYNLVIYLRGVLFSFILVLPFLLFFAIVTIVSHRNTEGLTSPNIFGFKELKLTIAHWLIPKFSNFNYFAVAFDVLIVFLSILAVWGLWRSINITKKYGEIGRPGVTLASILLAAVLIVAFLDAQQYALLELIKYYNLPADKGWLTYITGSFAAFSAAIGFLAKYAARLLKKGLEDSRWRARILRVATQAAIYLAAAALPILLWLLYLHFAMWGLCKKSCVMDVEYYAHDWLKIIAANVVFFVPSPSPLQLYLVVFGVLLLLLVVCSPNGNTLHRLYRDRLSKAFLFKPDAYEETGFDLNVTGIRNLNVNDKQRRQQDLLALDRLKISEIKTACTPYQIINAALNIRGSKYANRRGRNADFFIFSPKFIGSTATKYVESSVLETEARDFDLATAMAVSGAAASSNMGANTIKALSPTLTLLNIRLGFWLKNPAALTGGRIRATIAWFLESFYFMKEMFGLLREDDGLVYLTDGGHIENLGIYELLRRRCRLIIAVDAEADPQMNFNSLVALEQHALIDLGVRIDLPWAAIRDTTRNAAAEIAKNGGMSSWAAPHGPHCAIGEIEYPDGQQGILFYIKSSLSGDESDSIVDYKRRFPDFPHETTADQLFSEEQFEVYRSLGFHVSMRALNGEDLVAVKPKPQVLKRGKNPFIDEMLTILS